MVFNFVKTESVFLLHEIGVTGTIESDKSEGKYFIYIDQIVELNEKSVNLLKMSTK